MSDFSDWLQNNGVDLARLFVQIGILAAVIFYSRKLLRTLRASQEQLGALLRLSLSEGVAQQPASDLNYTAPAPSVKAAREESISQDFAKPASVFPPAISPAPSFASAPGFAAPAEKPGYAQSSIERPSYAHSSILGPINGSGGNGFSEREQSLGGRITADRDTATMLEEPPASSPSEMPPLTPWVGAPVSSAADSDRGPVAAAVQWLQQAPAPKRKGASPFKKVVRWLQTPAGR